MYCAKPLSRKENSCSENQKKNINDVDECADHAEVLHLYIRDIDEI